MDKTGKQALVLFAFKEWVRSRGCGSKRRKSCFVARAIDASIAAKFEFDDQHRACIELYANYAAELANTLLQILAGHMCSPSGVLGTHHGTTVTLCLLPTLPSLKPQHNPSTHSRLSPALANS